MVVPKSLSIVMRLVVVRGSDVPAFTMSSLLMSKLRSSPQGRKSMSVAENWVVARQVSCHGPLNVRLTVAVPDMPWK